MSDSALSCTLSRGRRETSRPLTEHLPPPRAPPALCGHRLGVLRSARFRPSLPGAAQTPQVEGSAPQACPRPLQTPTARGGSQVTHTSVPLGRGVLTTPLGFSYLLERLTGLREPLAHVHGSFIVRDVMKARGRGTRGEVRGGGPEHRRFCPRGVGVHQLLAHGRTEEDREGARGCTLHASDHDSRDPTTLPPLRSPG